MTNKIHLDKYYTSNELAKYCFDKAIEIIGKENITEYLEPSAGNGVFLQYFDKDYIALDLEPESENIIKQDYFDFSDEYKNGRLTIGNPPYGNGGNLLTKFTIKSIKHSDYVAFIMSGGFYNSKKIKGLIYSEDLGIKDYSGRKIHCCFNIYSREKYKNEIKVKEKIQGLKIVLYYRKKNKLFDLNKYCLSKFDYAFVRFGSIGKEIKFNDEYSNYILLKFDNEELKNKVINIIKNTDFKDKSKFNYNVVPSVSINPLLVYLKEQLEKQ